MAMHTPETGPVYESLPEGYYAAKQLLANREPGLEGLYRAAYPGYPGNFSRDSLIAARLADDPTAAMRQIEFSSAHQGRYFDSKTGQEPGKVHHELPAVDVCGDGHSTAYNACDTTALYLSTLAWLADGYDRQVLDRYADNVTAAVDYVKRHVTEDYLFAEDPRIVQATSYSLRVTYWKDSILNNPDRESPAYPIVYTQAHFQNAEALQLIGEATGDESLVALANEMFAAGMGRLWAEDHFVTAIDQKGVIDAPSTDSLTSLLHIPPELLHQDVAASVETYMEQLETDAGYRAGIPEVTGRDGYHTDMVWTHEQALLHRAAQKHGLLRAQTVAERIMDYFEPEEVYFPELVDATTLEPAGNRVQYWSVETYKYFHERGVQPSPVGHEGTARSFR